MDPYIGEIRLFSFDFLPKEWLPCDGRQIPIYAYVKLFSVVSFTYGGDGKQNFKLPDLRGLVPVGMGAGPSLSPRTLGQKFGSRTTALGMQHFEPHRHMVFGKPGAAGTNRANGPSNLAFLASPGNVAMYAEVTPEATSPAFLPKTIGPVGTDTGIERDNEQPYLDLGFCIAYDGIFPSKS